MGPGAHDDRRAGADHQSLSTATTAISTALFSSRYRSVPGKQPQFSRHGRSRVYTLPEGLARRGHRRIDPVIDGECREQYGGRGFSRATRLWDSNGRSLHPQRYCQRPCARITVLEFQAHFGWHAQSLQNGSDCPKNPFSTPCPWAQYTSECEALLFMKYKWAALHRA